MNKIEDEKVINLKRHIRFVAKEVDIIDYMQVYTAVLLVLEDKDMGKILEICDYSEVLLVAKVLNLERNTSIPVMN